MTDQLTVSNSFSVTSLLAISEEKTNSFRDSQVSWSQTASSASDVCRPTETQSAIFTSSQSMNQHNGKTLSKLDSNANSTQQYNVNTQYTNTSIYNRMGPHGVKSHGEQWPHSLSASENKLVTAPLPAAKDQSNWNSVFSPCAYKNSGYSNQCAVQNSVKSEKSPTYTPNESQELKNGKSPKPKSWKVSEGSETGENNRSQNFLLSNFHFFKYCRFSGL